MPRAGKTRDVRIAVKIVNELGIGFRELPQREAWERRSAIPI